jgi:hypothetical protein
MEKINKILIVTIILFISISCGEEESNNVDPVPEYTVWNGGEITFEKADGADPTSAVNQDRITDKVWITRGNSGGQIYNIVKETIYDEDKSPLGTKWAVGTLQQIDQLSFDDFRATVGSPKIVVGKNLVLFLQEDKTYLSVKFTSWSSGKGNGGFAYERSTP